MHPVICHSHSQAHTQPLSTHTNMLSPTQLPLAVSSNPVGESLLFFLLTFVSRNNT